MWNVKDAGYSIWIKRPNRTELPTNTIVIHALLRDSNAQCYDGGPLHVLSTSCGKWNSLSPWYSISFYQTPVFDIEPIEPRHWSTQRKCTRTNIFASARKTIQRQKQAKQAKHAANVHWAKIWSYKTNPPRARNVRVPLPTRKGSSDSPSPRSTRAEISRMHPPSHRFCEHANHVHHMLSQPYAAPEWHTSIHKTIFRVMLVDSDIKNHQTNHTIWRLLHMEMHRPTGRHYSASDVAQRSRSRRWLTCSTCRQYVLPIIIYCIPAVLWQHRHTFRKQWNAGWCHRVVGPASLRCTDLQSQVSPTARDNFWHEWRRQSRRGTSLVKFKNRSKIPLDLISVHPHAATAWHPTRPWNRLSRTCTLLPPMHPVRSRHIVHHRQAALRRTFKNVNSIKENFRNTYLSKVT